MRIIITGGREYTDYDLVFRTLLEYVDQCPTIVNGGERGADTLAENVARALGFPVEKHPANWKELGPMAGPIRNQQMIDLGADLVIAFPGGRGTLDCVRKAVASQIDVRNA